MNIPTTTDEKGRKTALLTPPTFAAMWRNASDVVAKLEPIACDCEGCKQCCQIAPCMGTPEDMERLVMAGHSKKLALTTNYAFARYGVPPVKMIAPLMTEQGCAFLDKLGHCTLHASGLKPLEGKLSHCQRTVEEAGSIPMHLFQSWL